MDREVRGPSADATRPARTDSDIDSELDTDFQVEFEEELEHHHLWHREGQRHHFGGDSPLLGPRTAALVRYVPRAHPAGFIVGTAFALISLTPSLIPRTYLFQGLATGISGGLGYGLGVALAWLAVRLARAIRRGTHVTRTAPVWFTPGSWVVLVVTAVVALLWMLIAGAGWQRQVAVLMGIEQPTTDGWLRAGPVALVVAGLIVGFGRGVRWLAARLADLLRRRAHVPGRVAGVAATLLVLLLVVTVADALVLRTGLRVADAAFSATNNTSYPGVVAPASPLRSGSPASLVRWDTLGREGQDFVAGGPPTARLAAASGRPAVDPIRAYVGLLSAPSPEERAALAVAELERTGAFDRSVIAVVTTTGTGWIDDPVADSLEMIWGGDTAIVATQYSYLPSWLSFLVDRTRAQAEGRALFDAVHARIAQMPPDRRPRLFAFGESLGSQGSEAAFSSLEDARTQADGVLWVGPPNSNRLHASLTARRDPGTSEILPVVGDGRDVRFGATIADLGRPPSVWSPPHVVYLQHASDPVVWWSPALLWSRPDWLAEPRGPDVSEAMDWYPVVTFWQVTIDLTNSLSVPDGHGHQYRGVMVGGWLSLGTPAGWTPADTARVAGMLGV
ncbi:alpha/beta hydrolase [Actinomycetospora sp. C-140]